MAEDEDLMGLTPGLIFLNNVIVPWHELNTSLSKNYALQPQLSKITAQAKNLAEATSHFPEQIGSKRLSVQNVPDLNVIDDIADSLKHGVLRNPARQCKLSTISLFEKNSNGQFSFLTNQIVIEHATLGTFDLMHLLLQLISYYIDLYGEEEPAMKVNLRLATAEPNFLPEATLRVVPGSNVVIKQIRVKVFIRNELDELVLAPEGTHITVKVIEDPEGAEVSRGITSTFSKVVSYIKNLFSK